MENRKLVLSEANKLKIALLFYFVFSLFLCASAQAAKLKITTAKFPGGIVGTAYSQTVCASGGTTPYAWAGSALPTGLSLASTGTPCSTLSGTPTRAAIYSSTVTVTDAVLKPYARAYAITVSTSPPPVQTLKITTTSLPSGVVGTAYSTLTFAATGGTPPYQWSVLSGSIPAGLTLSSGGTLSGTPTYAAVYSFTIQVKDASTPQQAASVAYSVTISAAPPPPATLKITTTSLLSGTVGQSYSSTLTATGGTLPYTWSVQGATCSGGSCPAFSGLSLAQATGILSGTPNAPGTFSPTFRVVDSSSPQQSYSLSLVGSVSPVILFADNFASGDFSLWDAVDGGSAVTIVTTPVYQANYAASFHYTIPSGTTQPTSEDLWTSKILTGQSDVHLRAYVYFQTPQPDQTPGVSVQRKTFWLSDSTSPGDNLGNFQVVLDAWNGSGGVVSPTTIYFSLLAQSTPCGVGNIQTYNIGTVGYNAWHSIEIEAKLNTPAASGPYNGVFNLWIDGTQTYAGTGLNLRGSCTGNLSFYSIGEQVAAGAGVQVDEYRFFDGIVVANAYIGP